MVSTFSKCCYLLPATFTKCYQQSVNAVISCQQDTVNVIKYSVSVIMNIHEILPTLIKFGISSNTSPKLAEFYSLAGSQTWEQ